MHRDTHPTQGAGDHAEGVLLRRRRVQRRTNRPRKAVQSLAVLLSHSPSRFYPGCRKRHPTQSPASAGPTGKLRPCGQSDCHTIGRGKAPVRCHNSETDAVRTALAARPDVPDHNGRTGRNTMGILQTGHTTASRARALPFRPAASISPSPKYPRRRLPACQPMRSARGYLRHCEWIRCIPTATDCTSPSSRSASGAAGTARP